MHVRCIHLDLVYRELLIPEPFIINILPVIYSVVLDERYNMLHPGGPTFWIASNEHIAWFGNENAL